MEEREKHKWSNRETISESQGEGEIERGKRLSKMREMRQSEK